MFGKRNSDGPPPSTAPKPTRPAQNPQSQPQAPQHQPPPQQRQPPAAVPHHSPAPAAPRSPAPAPRSTAPAQPKTSLVLSESTTGDNEKVLTFKAEREEGFYRLKARIFNALIDSIDLTQLLQLDPDSARDEIRDVVSEIIIVENIAMSISEQEELLQDICSDVLGYGPLDPLLERDDINDIMVNGPHNIYVEISGKVLRTNLQFRDRLQLVNICQRIVGQVGRRIDESSPICDARLPDGSRVNVIGSPIALDGPNLTIRKFRREKITLDSLRQFGSIDDPTSAILKIISACQCNILVVGGTGSGKTTLLNALTGAIASDERIVTCEDSAELQLQQLHVVRLETRPANLEGRGLITMTDLVRNCLRMRPERILVGEVRGGEAFDLLQAMNTGHSGSMGTLHANSPRDSLARLESMVIMAGYNLPAMAIRHMIASSIDIITYIERLRDGTRKVMSITEVLGLEGETIILQDIVKFAFDSIDSSGKVTGRHYGKDIGRPNFYEKAAYFGLEQDLTEALSALQSHATRSGGRL